ncbi:VanZ family protein [Pseudoneobacillus sp. C159]
MKNTFIYSTLVSLLVFGLISPVVFQLVDYLHPIVISTLFFCVWVVVTIFVLWIRKETISMSFRTINWVLTVYSVSLIILLFFRPSGQNYDSYNLIPFTTISFFLSGKVSLLVAFYNLAANIGLFIPYGIYLMFRRECLRKMDKFQLLFLPLIIISIIECLQYLTHRGSLDIDDLILNMVGILLGYLSYPLFKHFIALK